MRLTISYRDYTKPGMVDEIRVATLSAAMAKLQKYEDAEEQGRLVILPCNEDAEEQERMVEVRHGRWIDTDNYYQRWKCSVCGSHTRDARPPFCPNCGAKMDGGRDNV